MEGKIICIGSKYVIEGDRRHLKLSPVLNNLLPGDIVEYSVNPITEKIIISRLVSRIPIKTIGLINSINSIKSIKYPLLPNIFTLSPDLTNVDLTNPTCVIQIDSQGPHIISQWEHLGLTRKNDWKIILDLYKPIESQVPILRFDISKNSLPKYQDLTNLDTFNIDPPESKDFDDAISIDISNSKIYIHIVDTHNQILPGSQEDKQGLAQTFTLYLPEHIKNILPDQLANIELSLIKSEIRKTVTIEYTLNPLTLEIDDEQTQIYLSIIKISSRYNYETWDSSSIGSSEWIKKFLQAYKNKFNPVCLDTPSIKLEIDQNTGLMIDYQIQTSQMDTSPSHQLVTWLMIHTNITVSKLIEKSPIPQRYHSKAMFQTSLEQSSELELDFPNLTSNKNIDAIIGIKKFKKAIYSSNNSGHYGLKLQSYTHFTSPIRRYFDQIIHRLLGGISYQNLPEVLDYINLRETYIDSIVRLYSKLKILGYLDSNKHIKWIGYWIPQGLILQDLLFEIKYYPVRPDKLYTQVKIEVTCIDWFKLEPKIIIHTIL
jgi:exoribonuclease R